jgi:hypothetical protein
MVIVFDSAPLTPMASHKTSYSEPLSFDEIMRRALTIKPDKPKKKSRPKGSTSVKQLRMNTVTLNAKELSVLFRQSPTTKGDGGWQKLLVTLQELTDEKTGEITIPARIAERIQRYAFDYGNGGWEARLTSVFGRTLGAKLGR